MSKKIIKDSFVEIRKTNKKFLSIIIIVLLGVGFFCGIKATGPDMKNNINTYFKNQKVYDIKIMSSLLLNKDDINSLYNIKNVTKVVPSISFDTYADINNNEKVLKVLSITPDINKLVLIKGKLPQKDDEVVVEETLLTKNNIKINDYININLVNDTISVKNEKVKIVGTIRSPLYLSKERGTTNLGTGSIDFYIYMKDTNIISDYYTEVYLSINTNKKVYSNEYKDEVSKVIEEIKKISKERIIIRNNELLDDFDKKIDNLKSKLNNQKKEFNNSINYSKKLIKEKQSELESLKNINNQYNELSSNIIDSENKINTINKLLINETDINKISDYNKQVYVLEETKKELNSKKELIASSLLEKNISINNINEVISSYEKEIYNSNIKINNEVIETNKKFDEALKDINNSSLERDKLPKCKWYVLDLDSNIGYVGYLNDSERIDKVGKIFPLVFFIVAALMCLTSMTRMVEEQRSLIGTYKSLGYSNFAISFKYILYSLLATLIGSFLGMIIGFNTLPVIISNLYKMMYEVPTVKINYIFSLSLIGVLSASLSTLGATLYTVIKGLKQKPAELLRPVSPKPGKRVFLEKINFIWKRLKFTKKVTVRNLFRYKKRFFMTIIGIGGCTSLILAGFGLRDSITGVIPEQYGETFKYTTDISLKTNNIDEISNINEIIRNNENVKNTLLIRKEAIKITSTKNDQNITLVIPEDDSINSFINIDSKLNNEGVIITNKLSQLLNIRKNDYITLKNSNDLEINVKVIGITKNYVQHYIYMSKDLYEKSIETYVPNDIYVINDKEIKELSTNLLKNYEVSSITYLKNTKVSFSEVMDNMEFVAKILIFSASLLAFVVLYNLSNVNISERIRELATIKVLGFFDKEVYKYITREINILTIIGSILGLIGGYILTGFIVKTCELDIIFFEVRINLTSYFLAVVITLIFSSIVNFVTYFTLKKIDMVESLKSIE